MGDSIQALLKNKVREVLTLAIGNNLDEAKLLFSDIQPFFGKSQITKLFYKIVNGKEIHTISNSLLFIALDDCTLSDEEKSIILDAHKHVIDLLQIDALLVIFHIKKRGFFTPFANHVVDGVGAIFLEKKILN